MFKYWWKEYEEADSDGKVILSTIFFLFVLLLAIPIALICFLFVHKANMDTERAKWMAYKEENKCVAVAQKPPHEESHRVGKVSRVVLVAGDVVWKCNNGIVVISWEKSQ